MKPIKVILFIFLLTTGTLFAQAARLSAGFEAAKPAQTAQNLVMVIDIALQVDYGLFLQLPGNTKVVPFDIKRNGQSLWMKKDPANPQNNDAVHWQEVENGLILRFKEGLLQNGDQIELSCTPHVIDTTAAERRIFLRALSAQTPDSPEGSILDSRDFPSFKK